MQFCWELRKKQLSADNQIKQRIKYNELGLSSSVNISTTNYDS